MCNKSESIKNLAIALAKAQAEMPTAEFDAKNPFLKNKYASLGSIIKTATPVLSKHGLSFLQPTVSENNSVGVFTMVLHESGEFIEFPPFMLEIGSEKGKSTAQVAGSIITYLRRYSLASALGIYADEDNDGNQQQQPPTRKSAEKKPSSTSTPKPVEKPKNGDSDTLESKSEQTFEYDGVEYPAKIKNIESRDGEPYYTLPTERLSHMFNNLQKQQNPTPTQQKKMRTVELIFSARNNQPLAVG